MIHNIKENITAIDFLCLINKGVSKQSAKNMLKYSAVLVDGKKIKAIPTTMFKTGQAVEFRKNDSQTPDNKHPNTSNPFVIKYEDEHYLIAIKPAGMLSCKDGTSKAGGTSFDKMLEKHVSERDEQKTFLWIAHRIDREVEGLMIFAKSEEAQFKIKEKWEDVTKKYLALTEGKPPKQEGFFESWLKDGPGFKVAVLPREAPDSKFAKTEYRWLDSYGDYELLEVLLHTGRKNQIRAHLAALGCPIVGDRKYGAEDKVYRQIRLCAYLLDFPHPYTGKRLQLEYTPRANFFKPAGKEDEHYKL